MGSNTDNDYSELQSALESIGLSAALIFAATLLSQGLGFITRVSMARYLPVDGYGNVVIGITILNLFGLVALIGLPGAISRYIPRKDTVHERRTIISSAFQIPVLISIILATITYITANQISVVVFGNGNLVWIIRIFAVILPAYSIYKLCLAGFRGYEKTYPRVLLQNILRPSFQLIGIIVFVTAGFGAAGIAFGYVFSFAVVSVVGLILLYRISDFNIISITKINSADRYRELLTFSIPLALSGAVGEIAKHSDLIILGIFKTSSEVGVYEVTFRLALFVSMLFMPAVGFLFQPIMSRLDVEKKQERMNELYTIITRWVVVTSFPVFVLFFFFSEQSLVTFFGTKYQDGGFSLQILVIGFMLALIPGHTRNFLTAVGDTKLLFYISTGTMILNLAINVVLIPTYGITGAATATVSSRILNNGLQSYYIWKKYNIHPYERFYVLPTLLMSLLVIILFFSPVPSDSLSFIEGLVFVFILEMTYFILILITRSLTMVELNIVDELLSKMGIPITLSNKFKSFVR